MLSYGSKEADELKKQICGKLSTKVGDDETLPELIVLMLTNGQKRDLIAKTLKSFFDEKYIKDFLEWLYNVIEGKNTEESKEEKGDNNSSIVEPPPPPHQTTKKKEKEELTEKSSESVEIEDKVTGKKRKRDIRSNKPPNQTEFEKIPKKLKIDNVVGGKDQVSEEKEVDEVKNSKIVDLTKRSSRFDFLNNKPLTSGRRKHTNLSWRRTDN